MIRVELDKAGQEAVAEFFGAFALVFISAGSLIVAQPAGIGIVGVALAAGLTLAVMISVTGHISGGHFNPAVTIGVWVTGNIKSALAAIYIVAQLAGGIAAALLLRALLPETVWQGTHLGSPVVTHSVISTGQAVIWEAVMTFFLVYAVFGTAVDDRGSFAKIAGLPIGLVLTFDILAGGALTGAAVNPARALGPMLAGGFWTDWWVYWVGPIGGAVVAAAVYWFTFLDGREKLVSARRSEHPIGGPSESEWGDEPA